MSTTIPEISPSELLAELRGIHPPALLDVREAEELAISAFPDSINIPIGELVERKHELDTKRRIIVVCRSGARSANATSYLLHEGFKDVHNLATGINGWARTIDPKVTVY